MTTQQLDRLFDLLNVCECERCILGFTDVEEVAA